MTPNSVRASSWRVLPKLTAYRFTVGALLVLIGAVGLHNALVYPAIAGYDAADHISYALSVVEHLSLPSGHGEYYTPPVFYVLAGASIKLGEALGLDDLGRGAQILDAVLMLVTAILLLTLGRIAMPRRPLVHVAALAFFIACPLVPRVGAMVHPQTLAMVFSTLALVLAVRMVRDHRFGVWEAVAIALALDLAALVRNVTIATAIVVLAVLAAVAVARPELRRRVVRALAIVALLTVAVPAPWYVYLQVRYGNALFGRGSASTVPLSQPYPASFYLDPGLPQVITAPQRNDLRRDFGPILYADTWGDYFGVWAWGYPPHDLTPAVNDRLELQSIVGLVPTIMAGAGALALLGAACVEFRRRSERLLVPLMPLAALIAALLYAIRSPATDRDTVKALFLLTGIPALALCFGVSVDLLWHRAQRSMLVLAPVLVACGVISLAFGIR